MTLIRVRVTAITHQGLRRPLNEDTVAVGAWTNGVSMNTPYEFVDTLEQPLLCLIADGMGGHAAGEVASDLVARRLVELAPSSVDENSMTACIRDTNREVFAAMKTSPDRRGMGSTVVGMLLRDSGHIHFNVGDSRLYRYKGGFLRQLSIDDVRAAVPISGIEEERKASTVITQCLGGASSFTDIEPHVGTEPLVVGWRYLLCSDGLTDMVPLEKIEAQFGEDDQRAIIALLQAALAAGGHDNISIVLLTMEDAGS